MMRASFLVVALVGIMAVCSLLPLTEYVFAADYTSTNFTLRDPVITVGGGRATSTGFQLFNMLSDFTIGENAKYLAPFW